MLMRLTEQMKFLKRRVQKFMLLANYNGILRAVNQAKNVDYEYIRYASARMLMMKA